MISMPHLTNHHPDRSWPGRDCKSCSAPASNDDPVDGYAVGAVWGEGRWHLVKILPVSDVRYDGDQAACSCGWVGTAQVYTVAADDGERHTWAVSH
jgi:hypothetical protein